MYPIPGEDGGLDDRLMNYVWYRNVPAGPELTEMCIDKRGFPGSVSVHPGQVQDRYVAEMKRGRRRAARARGGRGGDRYQDALHSGGLRCPVLADGEGRVALIGDAACAARPHAAAGTAKAAADGWALAAALSDAGGDIRAR